MPGKTIYKWVALSANIYANLLESRFSIWSWVETIGGRRVPPTLGQTHAVLALFIWVAFWLYSMSVEWNFEITSHTWVCLKICCPQICWWIINASPMKIAILVMYIIFRHTRITMYQCYISGSFKLHNTNSLPLMQTRTHNYTYIICYICYILRWNIAITIVPLVGFTTTTFRPPLPYRLSGLVKTRRHMVINRDE